jgi:endogenous inhibitor of DNA gyrase (YacG/DUF329 family)
MIKEESEEFKTIVKWSSKTISAYLFTCYFKDGKPNNEGGRKEPEKEIKINCAWCGRVEMACTQFTTVGTEKNNLIENLSESDIITIWHVPGYLENRIRNNIEGDFNYNGEGCKNWDDQVNLYTKRSKKVEARYNDRIEKLKQIKTKELSLKNIDPWCSNRCKAEDGRDLNEVLEEWNKELNQIMKEHLIPRLIKTLEEYIPIVATSYTNKGLELREYWRKESFTGKINNLTVTLIRVAILIFLGAVILKILI